MGRIRTSITINARPRWALFDTGAVNSYIVEGETGGLQVWRLPAVERAAFGGKVHEVRSECLLIFSIEDYLYRTRARVVKEIGRDEEGREIKVLIGSLTMEEWRIRPIPDENRLDLSGYPREFVEFFLGKG
ncbi:MAG: hypothetical protein QXN89_03815 [Candidatus Woesearchaeota archaeon]